MLQNNTLSKYTYSLVPFYIGETISHTMKCSFSIMEHLQGLLKNTQINCEYKNTLQNFRHV